MSKLIEARALVESLYSALTRSHKYSTPLTEQDHAVDHLLIKCIRFLDDVCFDGGKHVTYPVDGKPWPCQCTKCGRALP